MNKLARMIDRLGKEELLLLQRDLDEGNIEKHISRRLQEYGEHKACPTCGGAVDASSAVRLEFGPADLRQQAFFDAPDCLQFFIKNRLQK